jgi:uncharacterized protein
MLDLKPIVHAILEQYWLPWDGTHGVARWARVLENGLRLAEMAGADIEVVQLFALFHDSQRVNEGTDVGHGYRGGGLAASLRGTHFHLSDERFDLLYLACAAHTDGLTEGNVTVQTCWDADRLDLGRVGIMPEPRRLCTRAAKKPEVLKWADRRGAMLFIPEFISRDWGIDTDRWDLGRHAY